MRDEAARRSTRTLERERNVVDINKQRWAFAIIGLVMATNASAKDVAGMFVGALILAGGLVGLIAGVVSPLLMAVRFLRGGVLAVGLSLIPWASLLFYWDFPFPNKTLIGNLPFVLFVLIGTVPVYLMVYGLVWFGCSFPRNILTVRRTRSLTTQSRGTRAEAARAPHRER
jgi:hypothetical protein